ncbi:MAG: DUF3990 domain-containing protein [Clostridia bacterium]|nr:DUF3990 domain-containing protein [Clostridia bacterium]
MRQVTLYHGSPEAVVSPAAGRAWKDFGPGFYCTEGRDSALEWACEKDRDGYVSSYTLDQEGLAFLNLLDGRHSILNWLAVVVQNRQVKPPAPIFTESVEWVTGNCAVDISSYDIIIGRRADYVFFRFVMDFLCNSITLRQFAGAMRIGDESQWCLKSPDAIQGMKFKGADPVGSWHYGTANARMTAYYKEYWGIAGAARDKSLGDLYMSDILREGIKPGDGRLLAAEEV